MREKKFRKVIILRLNRFILFFLFPLTVYSVFYFPGLMSNDSLDQYQQALSFAFTDWHPPVMAALWAIVDTFVPGPIGMLFLQGGLYWGGVYLLSVAGPPERWGAGKGLLFFTPVTTSLIGIIWKDVLMGGVLFFYSAFFYWCSKRNEFSKTNLLILGFLLILAGTLRQNAIFALPPLIFSLVRVIVAVRARHAVIASLLAACGVAMVSGVLNYGLLKAGRSHAEASVMVFDLGGISVTSGNDYLGKLIGRSVDNESCYQGRYWDTYAWGNCKYVYEAIKQSGLDQNGGLASSWLAAIADHPGDYLSHRFRFFKEFMLRPSYVGALPEQGEVVGYPYKAGGGAKLNARLLELMANSGLCAPVLPMLLSAAMLIVVLVFRRKHEYASLVAGVSSSALIYGMSFFIAGVSNDFRYAFWLYLAALTSVSIVVFDAASVTTAHRRA